MNKVIRGIATFAVFGLAFFAAKLAVQYWFNPSSTKIYAEEYSDKIRKELAENGAYEEVADILISNIADSNEAPQYAELISSYGSLLQLSDREIAARLEADKKRKTAVGLAQVKYIEAVSDLPLRLDEYTTYSGVHYDVDQESVVYHYSITDDSFVDLITSSDEMWEIFKERVEDGNPNAVCELSLALLAQGFDMSYSYLAPSGEELYRVVRTYEHGVALGYQSD